MPVRAARRPGLRILAALAVLALPFASAAPADAPPPSPGPYARSVGATGLVFVMLPPGSGPWTRGDGQVYAQSGLYRRDRPAVPLWSVDWYARAVSLTADGRWLVRLDERPLAPGDPAVVFYDAGRELARWPVERLVSDAADLPRTGAGVPWFRDGRIDESALAYTLTTRSGDVHVFDLRSGARVSHRRDPPPAWSATVTLADGRVEVLAGFHACGAPPGLPYTGDGRRVARDGRGILFRLDDPVPGGATVSRVSAVAFADLETARSLGAGTDGAPRWTLVLRSGRSLVVAADPALTRYCGRPVTGPEVALDATAILAIDGLTPVDPTPGR